MYFDAAEQKIAELEARILDLEGDPVDLQPILDAIAAIQTTQAAQAAELARLDARLDAISNAAKD